MHTLAILLKTYAGDIGYVDRLIKSFNKYNRDNIHMYLVAPEEELSLFRKYKGTNITLLSDESITDDLVVDNCVRGIRPGYVNQEIIKLAFWEKGVCDNYFCMDSDGYFIRKFYKSDFMYDKKIPYTILAEDNELKVDPEYYKNHWFGREKLIRKIQKEIGLVDRRMLTCHGFAVFSTRVLRSFKTKFLLPRKLTYKDILKISPYEFSWYNMWLQKDKTIPIEFKEPLIKFFHNKYQHLNYLRMGIKETDVARGYIGINVNSNYSRGFGVINYDESIKYWTSIEGIKSTLYNVVGFFCRVKDRIKQLSEGQC